ncbi:rRNA maturation RNase YbeY [Maribacter sp. HTCC2170]|uniref:rRNA maturation RNase YbeY n=1 Tax=Maribacter sp. (strain HTCC2170 / KCCM 42371) TaxID=313603 RepID=UPI00006BD2D9|nr:rRNA maturation RNase YbeY [Maribacter sp. HTCC2170]EAR02797.1 hypothetical protein FB2170_05900 [Maribacter sp. HTCC2170]
MIEFFQEGSFRIHAKEKYADWIGRIIVSEESFVGIINFIFCEDDYLLKVNQQHLKHDYFTDIITFDYTDGNIVSGDVFISTERIEENAGLFGVNFNTELLRVMSHGILHLLGYNDKSEDEVIKMRAKEEEKIKMFHVEQS